LLAPVLPLPLPVPLLPVPVPVPVPVLLPVPEAGCCVFVEFGSFGGVSPATGGCGPDEGTLGSVGGGAEGSVGGAGICGSGVRGGGGGDGAGGRGDWGGSACEEVDPEFDDPTCELATTRAVVSGWGLVSCAGEGAGSATTISPLGAVAASGLFVESFLPSRSGVGSKSERRRACRPVTPDDAAKERLSCTPRTALFREIAMLELWPPPTPGSSGRPGRARPTHSAPANVAVAASPADSKVDRSLDAIEGRVGVRRLLSIFANRST
jgi:hypothetical protein